MGIASGKKELAEAIASSGGIEYIIDMVCPKYVAKCTLHAPCQTPYHLQSPTLWVDHFN
jgi:hypothetical protein